MRILCCGDRYWFDYVKIKNELANYPNDTVIIHGCANGADKLSGLAAKSFNMEVLEFPAKWLQYGKAAGPIRNKQMLIEGKPDLVIAFHSDIENSKGTKNMINQAKKANIQVKLIS